MFPQPLSKSQASSLLLTAESQCIPCHCCLRVSEPSNRFIFDFQSIGEQGSSESTSRNLWVILNCGESHSSLLPFARVRISFLSLPSDHLHCLHSFLFTFFSSLLHLFSLGIPRSLPNHETIKASLKQLHCASLCCCDGVGIKKSFLLLFPFRFFFMHQVSSVCIRFRGSLSSKICCNPNL